jgi:RHS repeat-associated protein
LWGPYLCNLEFLRTSSIRVLFDLKWDSKAKFHLRFMKSSRRSAEHSEMKNAEMRPPNIAEYSNTAATGSGTKYITADHLGSTRLVTDATGNVLARHDYLPFGEEIPALFGNRSSVTGYNNSDDTKQKFTAKERDTESGLDNFRARYDSSSVGRFMNPDPSILGIAIGDPQSWNLYSYVRNRPTRFVDLGGKWPTELHVQFISVALHGYLSPGEIAHLQARQWVMDSKANQGPEKSYMHAMRNGKSNETVDQAKADIWGFVAGKMEAASSTDSKFTDQQLDALGDAIHTAQDFTSPTHTDRLGNPLPWQGLPTEGPFYDAYEHALGEASPANDWSRFGDAIRVTLAAFVQANQRNPNFTKQTGLTAENYEAEADRRISIYVREFFYFNSTQNPIAEDAARQCALGNPAACH